MPVDIHFWVMHNGVIVDKTIELPKIMATMMGGKQLVYLPYPADITKKIVEDAIKSSTEKGAKKGKTFKQMLDEGKSGNNDNAYNCIASSICYAYHNGGDIQVGCFGFLDKSNKINWLFGHPDNPYDKYETDCDEIILNERNTVPAEHTGLIYQPLATKKIKPNERCPCDSGIKYKKCCSKKN